MLAGATQSSSAAKFDTQRINFRARKPASKGEFEPALGPRSLLFVMSSSSSGCGGKPGSAVSFDR